MSRFTDNWAPDIRAPGQLGTRTTGHQDYWAPGLLGTRTTGHQNCWAPGLLGTRTTGHRTTGHQDNWAPDNWAPGLLGTRTTGHQDNWALYNWAPGQLGIRTTGLQDYWAPGQLGTFGRANLKLFENCIDTSSINQSIKVLFPQHTQSLTIYKYWHNSGKRDMQQNE